MTDRILVEKLKWDGSVSARFTARPIAAPSGALAWAAAAGTPRERPRKGSTDVIPRDQVSVAPGGWWIATGHFDGEGALDHYLVDAALPPGGLRDGRIAFVDLDLDLRFDGSRDFGELQDVGQFHRRARSMGYPDEVCTGAWNGLAEARSAYLRGLWPFDGWIVDMPRVASTVGGPT